MEDRSPQFISLFRPAAVIKATGDDALPFLQGQFTQELRSSDARLCAYGLWLNQKGKVLADSFVLRDQAAWWVVSLTSPAAVIRERLEAFIIADDVVLEDETERWAGCTLVGAGAGDVLRNAGFELPTGGSYAAAAQGWVFRGNRTEEGTWEWLMPVGTKIPEPIEKAMGEPDREAEMLERLRISAGRPRVPDDVGPGDLPNEAGLEERAISYTKGCYLGQEVIARLRSMGQVRRKLKRVKLAERASFGAALYRGEKKVGDLRTSAALNEKEWIGLAMVSLIAAGDAASFSLAPGGVETVTLLDLP